ncbi:MAG TPA: 4Fe-4S binding protein, partial [Anaerolineae bacterium]|nr:4Fe-4S binding protein [Anaerolineae bacterium]
AFCGWVCPLGTVLDLVGSLSPQRLRRPKRRAPGRLARLLTLSNGNSYLKYGLALAALVLSALSLKLVGLFDPLVVFSRTATVVASDYIALRNATFDVYLAASFLFVAIVLLELWRPRFWCRHLCPQGALLGWLSRWSLLNRRVSTACNYCGQCREVCPMNAIPKETHDTDYRECHFCLACEAACPQRAISFGWGGLAWAQWQVQRLPRRGEPGVPAQGSPKRIFPGRYERAERPRLERILGLEVSRRSLVGGAVAGVGALALLPALRLAPSKGLVRPPGALPEDEFVATCILCQECIRVCPTRGLKPVLFEGGLRALGTPRLVAREGGCQLNRSCDNLCARACPVGAIQIIPREKMRVGLAKVDRRSCLAWDQGVRCLVCVEACPTQAATPHQGRVTIDSSKCSGCGICERSCPVAGSAIHVVLENEVRYRRGDLE